jgi:ribosomal protein S18 acetylase RimI-like enzyme
MNIIDYKVVLYDNTYLKYKDAIKEFIKDTEKLFQPPISTRIELNEYINKLFNESIIYVAIDNTTDEIIGIVAFYCSPLYYDYAFLTYIAVSKQGLGVGSSLLEASLRHVKNNGMKGVDTQTWENNIISRQMFKKFGFLEIRFVANRNSDQNSVILRYEFK